MPKAPWREETNYAIPEDKLVPAQLESVAVVSFQSKDRDTKAPKFNADGSPEMYDRWRWTFKVYAGDYAGITVDRLTVPFISSHANNVVRIWAETLREKSWVEGEGLDTDQLIGLKCVITVTHDQPRPKKDGDGMWYSMSVADVFPSSAVDDLPPF